MDTVTRLERGFAYLVAVVFVALAVFLVVGCATLPMNPAGA